MPAMPAMPAPAVLPEPTAAHTEELTSGSAPTCIRKVGTRSPSARFQSPGRAIALGSSSSDATATVLPTRQSRCCGLQLEPRSVEVAWSRVSVRLSQSPISISRYNLAAAVSASIAGARLPMLAWSVPRPR